jgi:hypothetical protein
MSLELDKRRDPSPHSPIMELNDWTRRLRELFEKAVAFQREGKTDLAAYFSDEEKSFLSSIGLKPINVYDFAEDFADGGEPDWDTFLLIAAARRDYFLHEQHGQLNPSELDASELPARKATLGGLEWLPRIIVKARCFLEGGLCHDIMYCCGGDRNFLRKHGIHPADFLRVVWAAKGNNERVLAFVQKSLQALKAS